MDELRGGQAVGASPASRAWPSLLEEKRKGAVGHTFAANEKQTRCRVLGGASCLVAVVEGVGGGMLWEETGGSDGPVGPGWSLLPGLGKRLRPVRWRAGRRAEPCP